MRWVSAGLWSVPKLFIEILLHFLTFFCVIEKAVCTVSIRTVSIRDQPRHLFEGDVQGMRRTGGTTDDLECAEVVGFILRRRCCLGPNRFSSNQRVYRRVREFADQRQSDGNRADTFHGEAWRVWETLFLDRRWSDLCPAPVCSRGRFRNRSWVSISVWEVSKAAGRRWARLWLNPARNWKSNSRTSLSSTAMKHDIGQTARNAGYGRS